MFSSADGNISILNLKNEFKKENVNYFKNHKIDRVFGLSVS